MKGIILLSLFSMFFAKANAESFSNIVKMLETHNLVLSQKERASSLEAKASKDGSWGDPRLSISAMNFPQNTLSQNESMMTGIQFGLSQKLSLSGKYSKLKESGIEKSMSAKAQSEHTKRELLKRFWNLCIEIEKNQLEGKVLSENYEWLDNNLKITKRLYSTGKVPQQAVLDIQIRRSELSAQLEQNKFQRESLKYQLSALVGATDKVDIDLSTIPWEMLNEWKNANDDEDYIAKTFQHNLNAANLQVSASRRDFISDITIGLNYTKRNDIDGIGDFVGASISFALPTSSSRYASNEEAVLKEKEAQANYRNYQIVKPSLMNSLALEIEEIKSQLDILSQQTLKYSKSSRDVTAKSYSRGGADYLELLRSELQYQNYLLKNIKLSALQKQKKVDFLFVKGHRLNNGSQK